MTTPTLDQFDTIHMCLRRATAITRLVAEVGEGRTMIEVPAKDVTSAMYIVLSQLESVEGVLRVMRSSEGNEDGVSEDGDEVS